MVIVTAKDSWNDNKLRRTHENFQTNMENYQRERVTAIKLTTTVWKFQLKDFRIREVDPGESWEGRRRAGGSSDAGGFNYANPVGMGRGETQTQFA